MAIDRKIEGPLAAWADAQIAAGIYANDDEIIRAGIVALAEKEAKVSNLKALIQQGLDDVEAGRVIQYDSPEDATAAIMNRTS